MRRLSAVVAVTALLSMGMAGTAAAEDLRDECYEHGGYRSATVCFKIPPGVPSPVDLD